MPVSRMFASVYATPLKMPAARGWRPGQTPVAAPGLKVNTFASGLDHPRWIEVLPNGDVLVAEATSQDRAPRSVLDYAMISMMRRAAAMGASAAATSTVNAHRASSRVLKFFIESLRCKVCARNLLKGYWLFKTHL